MKKLGMLLLGVFVACLCMSAAYAEDMATAGEAASADSYGYTADDVAVGQAVVAYWYACGFNNAFGNIPAKFQDITDKKVVLRGWVNPFNGQAINPDDGTLDGDGDFMYWADDCSFGVKVKTSAGEVSIPDVSLTATSDISVQWDPSCCMDLCGECCYIDCCDYECWNLCDEEAACKIADWMMWKSFELHECLYGHRPASEHAFMASGLSPVDKTYKEIAPNMSIEWVYKGDCCCYVKKANVNCCAPCKPCGCKDKCGCEKKCDTGCKKSCCEQKTCTKCDTKCGDKCGKKCDTGCKKSCCAQKTCTKCESKCGCKDKCGSKCGTKCGCEKKCDTGCKKDCCKQKTCTKCNKCDSGCKSKCGCK